MDFLNEYNNGSLRNEKIFHRNNIKKYIDTYIDFHNKEIEYSKRGKKWYCANNEKEEPF
jgi:hypothetical protein